MLHARVLLAAGLAMARAQSEALQPRGEQQLPNAANSLPSGGSVAIIIRGEAFRLGGRNEDASEQGGCKHEAADEQQEATRSMMQHVVWPLQARQNQVDIYATETSGIGAPCALAPTLQSLYEEVPPQGLATGGRVRVAAFAPVERLAGQAESMRFAMDMFKNASAGAAYDLIMFVRHDMIWTLAIDAWPPPVDFAKFSFLSRCQKNQGGDVEEWAKLGRSCVNDVLLLVPGGMFAAFDETVGAEGGKCFEAGFRHGAGHECYEAVATATGEPPAFATDYVPRGSVRRPSPLGWLIGSPPDPQAVAQGRPGASTADAHEA